MTLFKPVIISWKCPSCGEELELFLLHGEDGREKWVRSRGVWWGRTLTVGDPITADTVMECGLCRSEFTRGDLDRIGTIEPGKLKEAGE